MAGKMSAQRKESSHHQDNKLLIEAITTRMEQVMNSKLDAFCQEVKQRRAQHKTSRGSREPSKMSRDKEKPPPWRQHEIHDWRSKEHSKSSKDKEKPRLRRPHETPIRRSKEQSIPAKDKAENVSSYGDQSSLPQASKLQNLMDTQKIYEDFGKQILKAFKAVENSQKKRITPRPSSGVITTNQESSCSKKEPVVQKPETDQPLLIFKGMNETSNSSMCANETYMCHGREEDANAKPMVLEENVENHLKEQEKVSDSLLKGDECEITPAKSKWLENRTPCEVKSVLPSSQFDYVLQSKNTCAELISLEPVQPSRVECVLQNHEENLPENTQRIMPIVTALEPLTSHEPKPIPKSFLCKDHNKHCKEIGLPNLFVLVTPSEEKHFGLENVKEFCVSGFAFENMTQSFEMLGHKEFYRQKNFLFDEACDSNLAMSHNMLRKIFEKELIWNHAEFVIGECFSKIEHFTSLSRKELHANLCFEDFWVLKLNERNSFWKRDAFHSLIKLEKEFAWSERVLPEFNSHCALKKWWSCLSINHKYPFIHDPTYMICLSLSKGPYAGSRTALKHKRRVQRRDEDQRFKPPDLNQNRHQDVTLFMLIKQKPPDTKAALRSNRGNQKSLREEDNRFKPPDLDQEKYQDISCFISIKEAPPDTTDGSDLRTNSFQVGGDDMILLRSKEMELQPDKSKLEAEEHGAAMGQIAPFELKETRWRTTQGYSSHVTFRNKPSDTCVTSGPRNSAIGQVIHWHSFSLLWFCPIGFSKERVLMRLLNHSLIIQLLKKSCPNSPQPRQFSVKKRGEEVQPKIHFHSGQLSKTGAHTINIEAGCIKIKVQTFLHLCPRLKPSSRMNLKRIKTFLHDMRVLSKVC